MKDRQAANAGRIKLVADGGTTPQYYYMQMADNPTEPGTPLNKANLLSDTADSAVFGSVNANHTVSDAFYELGSSRIRPYNNKTYTCYPDLKHPYIDVGSHILGSAAYSHVVITKNYYVVQTSADGYSKYSVTFKAYQKANLSASPVTFSVSTPHSSGDVDTLEITRFDGDALGDVVEIHYTVTTVSGGETYVNYYTDFINVAATDPWSSRYSTTQQAGSIQRQYLIWQATSGQNTYFWTYQCLKVNDDYYAYIRRYAVTDSQISASGSAYRDVGIYNTSNTNFYSVNELICDGSYFYLLTHNYSTQDSDTGNNSVKILRCPIGSPSFTNMQCTYMSSGEVTRWTTSNDKEWIPYWVEDGVIYFRRRTNGDAYYIYTGTIDNTNNTLLVKSFGTMTSYADASEYLGHIDNTHVLFVGIASSAAKFTVGIIGSSSMTFTTLRSLSDPPNGVKQQSPVTFTKSKIKHILPALTTIPAGVGSAVRGSGTSFVFNPIYAEQTTLNVWTPLSVFAVDHDVSGTAKTSLIVSSAGGGAVLTTDAEVSDIRYLPGYFREGRTT